MVSTFFALALQGALVTCWFGLTDIGFFSQIGLLVLQSHCSTLKSEAELYNLLKPIDVNKLNFAQERTASVHEEVVNWHSSFLQKQMV